MVLFILSALFIIASFLAVGIIAGKQRKNADFSLGGRQTSIPGVVVPPQSEPSRWPIGTELLRAGSP